MKTTRALESTRHQNATSETATTMIVLTGQRFPYHPQTLAGHYPECSINIEGSNAPGEKFMLLYKDVCSDCGKLDFSHSVHDVSEGGECAREQHPF